VKTLKLIGNAVSFKNLPITNSGNKNPTRTSLFFNFVQYFWRNFKRVFTTQFAVILSNFNTSTFVFQN